jgi:hypothetical protein
MKRALLAFALLLPILSLAQDRCPSFKVTKQRSGMHYELKKYKPKKLPREGMVLFAGVYATPKMDGYGLSGRIQMVELGFSGGWDMRNTDPYMLKKAPDGLAQYTYTNAFGATIGKYYMFGLKNRGLIDFGLGYGRSASSTAQNKLPFFGYGLASVRVYRDVWFSGSVHVMDFRSTPIVSFGMATLIW